MKKKIPAFFSLLVIGLATLAFFNYRKGQLSGKQKSQAIIRGLEKLDILWREGLSDILLCEKRFENETKSCNPDYLSCILNERGWLLEGLVFDKDYRLTNKIHTKSLLAGKYNIELYFRIKDNRKSKKYSAILSPDICETVYLPRRIYGYNEKNNKDALLSWKFDNFDENIFIDKFHVSDKHIERWLEFIRPEFGSIHLNESQIKRYCSDFGKEVLPAHYYDAMTFYPYDYKNVRPNSIRKSKYLSKNKKASAKVGISWIGAYDVIGKNLEYVINPIEEGENMISNSIPQILGGRISWDGMAFSRKSFSPPFKTGEDRPVRFRCMKRFYE